MVAILFLRARRTRSRSMAKARICSENKRFCAAIAAAAAALHLAVVVHDLGHDVFAVLLPADLEQVTMLLLLMMMIKVTTAASKNIKRWVKTAAAPPPPRMLQILDNSNSLTLNIFAKL